MYSPSTHSARKIEWAKSRARARRYQEEIQIVGEEMKRTLRFFKWKESKWRERAFAMSMSGSAITPEHDEGLRAYADRQAKLCRALHDKCEAKWRVVPEMRLRAKVEVTQPQLLFKRKAKEQARIFNRQRGGIGMLGSIRTDDSDTSGNRRAGKTDNPVGKRSSSHKARK